MEEKETSARKGDWITYERSQRVSRVTDTGEPLFTTCSLLRRFLPLHARFHVTVDPLPASFLPHCFSLIRSPFDSTFPRIFVCCKTAGLRSINWINQLQQTALLLSLTSLLWYLIVGGRCR